jgi:hypothetical protein
MYSKNAGRIQICLPGVPPAHSVRLIAQRLRDRVPDVFPENHHATRAPGEPKVNPYRYQAIQKENR